MRGMILAVSPEGVIGLGGKIPWRHPGDMRRFKRVTLGSTVIMGRATFDETGKPLPGRRNIVVTSRPLDVAGVERVGTVDEALARAGAECDVWFIGGARIYEEAMGHVDVIDVTYVPDHVDAPGAVHAPPIDERVFEPGPLLPHEDEPGLTRRVYRRRAP
ncbi:MAG TPA: dihydrofolate reductase [Polyangiaceae bacterium]|nr:dihydrofolate reductase [Polyangiaceae bacterium]